MNAPNSHGSGEFSRDQLGHIGNAVIIEDGVRIFHPDRIWIGDRVYVGHDAILKGYYKNQMHIGDGCWIGQQCFFHSAGGITLEEDVGVGPGVKILTSNHLESGQGKPIMAGALEFRPVRIGRGSDIGMGAILLPGVTLGQGVQVGAGAVVTKDVQDFAVVVGNPATLLRIR